MALGLITGSRRRSFQHPVVLGNFYHCQMLTEHHHSVATTNQGTSSSPASSATRPSRLRGLTVSYLRNYTQTHLLSRDSPAAAPPPQPQPFSRPSLPRSESGSPSSGPGDNILQTGDSSREQHRDSLSDRDTGRTGAMTRTRAATTGDQPSITAARENMPSIRFCTYYDARATRPSLSFTPMSRTLSSGREIIRVGRYSERDTAPASGDRSPSVAPVGFRSKVVSRRHCEFWCEGGKWYIKDVKSSSGTFLNHVRLSPPATESRPFPINDGDIVQLGMDFRGGEETIFRSVKMRLELNRGWQSKPNNFKYVSVAWMVMDGTDLYSMTTHKNLRSLAAHSGEENSSQICSICLSWIAVSSIRPWEDYSLTHTAMSIPIRRAVLAHLALQVHPRSPPRPIIPQLCLSQLQGMRRPRRRRRRHRARLEHGGPQRRFPGGRQ